MGVHHYKIAVIPKQENGAYDYALLQEGDHWGSYQPPEAFLGVLRGLLPKNTSWGSCEEFRSNHEWGSDLRIWHEDELDGNPVFAIVFRFSAGADEVALLDAFLSATQSFKLMIYAEQSRQVLSPQLLGVLKDLKISTAHKFLSKPREAVLEASIRVSKNED